MREPVKELGRETPMFDWLDFPGDYDFLSRGRVLNFCFVHAITLPIRRILFFATNLALAPAASSAVVPLRVLSGFIPPPLTV